MASEYTMGAGGGAGEQGTPPTPNVYAVGGAGLPYNIADGSTSIVYAGGGGGSAGYPMPTPYSPEAPGGGGRGIGGSNSQAEPANSTKSIIERNIPSSVWATNCSFILWWRWRWWR